jgi:UDPglucose 6-dehydrogenase
MGKVGVIGIGRLGLCFALNLEKAGYNVIGYDIRQDYVNQINNKTFYSSEPGLDKLLQNSIDFEATCSLEKTLDKSRLLFVNLRTDSDLDGKYNHDQIESFLYKLKKLGVQKNKKHLVICSNVQPGYTNTVAERLRSYNYDVSFNPETIAQGQIVKDQVYPNILIIGEENKRCGDEIISVYENMCKSNYSVHRMDRTSAEISKVGLNCSLTAKISMANTIGNVAIRMGGDADKVLNAIGSDERIGDKYFKYGFGYGGPCFPRDNRAFILSASQVGIDAHMNKACDKTNKDHLQYQIENFSKENSKDKPVIINEVTFKKGSDIIEESQQLEFALGLVRSGFHVIVKEKQSIIDKVNNLYGNIFTYERVDETCVT